MSENVMSTITNAFAFNIDTAHHYRCPKISLNYTSSITIDTFMFDAIAQIAVAPQHISQTLLETVRIFKSEEVKERHHVKRCGYEPSLAHISRVHMLPATAYQSPDIFSL